MKTTNRKRIFYDIEVSYTKGFFWRAGYNQTITPKQILEYPKIICISYKWEGSDKVQHLKWDKNKCDKKLLERFIKIIDKADEIVAHNGDRFDLKWIRARALKHGLFMRPFYKTIDTLKICRSLFNLPSNKLGEVANYLGLDTKLETGGLELWVNIVEYGCKESMKTMLEYCDQDVRVLENVFIKLKPYSKASFNYSVQKGGAKYFCPECGGWDVHTNRKYTTPAGTQKHIMRCKDSSCNKYYSINSKVYQDWLNFKMMNNIK